jgi:hypothetical protein
MLVKNRRQGHGAKTALSLSVFVRRRSVNVASKIDKRLSFRASVPSRCPNRNGSK